MLANILHWGTTNYLYGINMVYFLLPHNYPSNMSTEDFHLSLMGCLIHCFVCLGPLTLVCAPLTLAVDRSTLATSAHRCSVYMYSTCTKAITCTCISFYCHFECVSKVADKQTTCTRFVCGFPSLLYSKATTVFSSRVKPVTTATTSVSILGKAT